MKAIEYFDSGFNCAESVLLASVGKQQNVPRVATGFGGGMGRMGEVCGALTGALMALGVKGGRDEPDAEKRDHLYVITRELFAEFGRKFGSTLCVKLTGCNLLSEEGKKKFSDEKIHNTKCHNFVTFCEEWVKERT
jgi:C_GCAxxG_C_C family probable redox protein